MVDGLPDPARALTAALDVVPDHVVLLSEDGHILFANAAWRAFARTNGGQAREWRGVDYLAAGSRTTDDGTPSDPVTVGIRDVLAGRREHYEQEYACHAPDRLRWFAIRVARVDVDGVGAVVTHSDVSRTRSTSYVLGWSASHDPRTGLLTAEAIEAHTHQMLAEGRGVTTMRLVLDRDLPADHERSVALAATTLMALFPPPTSIGRIEGGLVIVQGGASDGDLLRALQTTYDAIADGLPDHRVHLIGERLSPAPRPTQSQLPTAPTSVRPAVRAPSELARRDSPDGPATSRTRPTSGVA